MQDIRKRIALVGNPNSGKTTLFNLLSGLNQKVANFPGVTVDKKEGHFTINKGTSEKLAIEVLDLPGTYSLYPKAIDEAITFEELCIHGDSLDCIIVVLDASNLKRSLLLATQCIDLGKPCLLALNMIDLAERQEQKTDIRALAESLGVRVVAINARSNKGIEELKEQLFYVKPAEEQTNDYRDFLLANYQQSAVHATAESAQRCAEKLIVKETPPAGKKQQAEDVLQRYTSISALLAKVHTRKAANEADKKTLAIDHVLTHKIWGYFIFLFVLYLIFQAIFSWSEMPMNLIEQGFLGIRSGLDGILPKSMLSDLLINGLIPGIAGVAVFIPQIALLFFFIGILEDSGYMARVSYIMDRLMRRFGLNGKSVIPLISGFACAVPAIMSVRTIQNWRERLITIFITPLMSCSARIPVYTLLISMVIPDKRVGGIFSLQGLTMLGVYLLGVVLALLIAVLFKNIVKSEERSYFMLELPVYRQPRWQSILLSMYDKVKIFLFDAGKVIIVIALVLWALASFAPGKTHEQLEQKYALIERTDSLPEEELQRQLGAEKLETSYAGVAGKTIEPLIAPLGFDWKIGISLITSFAAREVFVGTMATIYSVGEEDVDVSLKERMLADTHSESGKPVYTLATGLALIIFFALAMQCMSTVAIVKRETNSWKWPILQTIVLTALAYGLAYAAKLAFS